MKLLWLAFAVLVVAGILMSSRAREYFGYTPEFVDSTMARVTREGEVSSYAQKTNHLKAPDSHSPPRGSPTGHRVGQFEGHTAPF